MSDDFVLSEKRTSKFEIDRSISVVFREEDVKEFIRLVSELGKHCYAEREFYEKLNKIAGEKLI